MRVLVIGGGEFGRQAEAAMVDAGVISGVLSRAASADDACQDLLAAALRNGGKDNVTVALARYRFPR